MAAAVECLRCSRAYTEQDIRGNRYFIKTKMCAACYAMLQQAPHQISCFGKPSVVLPDGKRMLGYNPDARECRLYCPDREICKVLVRGTNED